jgi:two-component system phosphate regulon sensor histidine kinase PhoR
LEKNERINEEIDVLLRVVNAGLDGSDTDFLLFLQRTDLKNFRITLTDEKGMILFENFNNSKTANNLSRYKTLRRDDGKTMRISINIGNYTDDLIKFIPTAISMVVLILIIVMIAGKILTGKIIRSINEIDLDKPEESVIYPELTPLLRRIKEQNDTVANQMFKLQKNKNQFDIITSNMQEGLLILDKHNNILRSNESAKYLLRSESFDVVNRNILVLCRNERFRNAIKKMGKNKQEVSFEIESRTIRMTTNPIINAGEKIGTAILLSDITEQADREELRREFSANVSHELKTPLSVISGYSEIIFNGLAKQSDIADFGKKIYSESQHLLSLINDIIQLSSFDENSDFAFEKVNVLEAVRTNVSNIRQKADEKNIEIKISGESLEIMAVVRLLDEILYNILENAIKYNRENGKVDVSISQEDNFAVIEIFDTGIGIHSSQYHRIFERFYRIDSSRTGRQNGTGLGLSIVKHAVKIHKGSVTITSSEGEWTKFTVKFPVDNG